MDTKPWWQSRTIWLQIVAGLFALGGAFKVLPAGIDQEQVVSAIMVAVTIATGVLRLRMTTTIVPVAQPVTAEPVGIAPVATIPLSDAAAGQAGSAGPHA